MRKDGDVVIHHHGRQATVLRGAAATRFLADVERKDPQEVMAQGHRQLPPGQRAHRRGPPAQPALILEDAPDTVPLMTATVRGFTTGWLETELAGLLEGGEGRHPDPGALVPRRAPEGQPGVRHRPPHRHAGRPGGRASVALARHFASELAPDTAVHERAAALEVTPDMVVCSHLHFDHCGGNDLLGDVPIVVQRTEWEAAHGGVADGRLRARRLRHRAGRPPGRW